ncbi:MAG: zeta toxin family protein [Patescibacteria group bacterium]
MNDELIRRQAVEFAKSNRRRLAKELTDTSKYVPDEIPISVFMAGSPGAGKTEYSKNFIEILEKDNQRKVIRIDSDELRRHIPGYRGNNSYLFQGAVSILVEKIQDMALENEQTFLFDGTLSKYDKAVANINRSLDKFRRVFILYVYQQPEVAWRFTVARESVEGRHIPKDAFIEQFIGARETVERIRKEFDSRVVIFLVKKNFETHEVEEVIEIKPNDYPVDYYLKVSYTKDDLEGLL